MVIAVTPWRVVASKTYPEMSAVEGAYLVADNLPIEDANAIAAAPDLLEALRETRDNIWNYWTPNTERGMKRRDALLAKADAAIAKAEGRS